MYTPFDKVKAEEVLKKTLFLLEEAKQALESLKNPQPKPPNPSLLVSEIIVSPDDCDHIAGSSPIGDRRDPRGRTSIVWHTTNETAGSVVLGFCLVCLRQFKPEDPDYNYWRKKPSFNLASSAGREEPILPGEEIPAWVPHPRFRENVLDLDYLFQEPLSATGTKETQ
jgi:hypothetical protein